VLVPALVNPEPQGAGERARGLLERVGLADRADYRPGQLSGGERQRVAVVRALINRPSLLLADEPTGSLNQEGADSLTSLLLELNREEGMTLVVVTHSLDVAERMDRVLQLREGVLLPSQ
jgi:lipoprotein-releasing system ATP-binding protein